MVDFQSRDTNRTRDDADESDDEPVDDDDDTEEAVHDDATNEAAQDGTAERSSADAVSVAILVAEEGGDTAADALADALTGEHDVLGRDERTGDHDAIQTAVNTFLDQPTVDAVVTVGGVGVGPTQVTVEAVEPLLDTDLPGFGELFRRRYESRVDTGVIRTRAFAGLADGTPVVCLPGDAEAVTVATEELLVPELDWLASAAEGS